MQKKNPLAKILLYPMSLLYGAASGMRNKFFDWGILKEKSFDVPIIVVGNISAGGTGKTPHVEYIVSILKHSYNIGVVSRGYKRKTKGFVLATSTSTPLEIGDEPYQIYRKFGHDVTVAVCENRVNGITELLNIDPKINLIILDDAFQHRYVKPTAAVVVTEFNRPVFNDSLLPLGRLRESKSALHRADIIVVSKCPENPSGVDTMLYEKNLDLFPYQKSFFSKFEYGSLRPVFPANAPAVAPSLDWLTNNDMILTVAGIGNPKPFVKYIRRFKARVWVNLFSDHHNFSKKDMALIKKRFSALRGENNYIITTEKDAVRIATNKYFPEELKPYIYFLPIKVKILRNEGQDFETLLKKIISRPKF